MFLKSVIILGLIFVVTVNARYDLPFTKKGKDCLTEIGTDEDTIKGKITDKGILTEDDMMEKFVGCCFSNLVKDDNEIIVDDTLKTYMTNIFTTRLDGKRGLADLCVEDCIEHCKTLKGDTKGKTGMKVFNCMMDRLDKILEKTD